MMSTTPSCSVRLREQALASVRLVSLDYVLNPPLCPELDPVYSSYRGSDVKRLPVLRVFGPTFAGQKTCLHIHGVFPYIYIRLPKRTQDPEEFGYRLTLSLDKALNMVLGAGTSNQHIFRVATVKAKSMYGYHPEEELFLKIYFYNPGMVKKASDLLINGAIMDQMIEPFESHIPFTLQFMMDYNLQGMNLVHLSHALFRLDATPEEEALGTQSLSRDDLLKVPPPQRKFNVQELSAELLLSASIPKTSRSSLEMDAVATDLLNKDGEANPGLSAMWEDEVLRRRDKQLPEEDIPNSSSPLRGEAQTRMTESEKYWNDKFQDLLKASKEMEETTDLPPSGSSLPLSNSLDIHVSSLGNLSLQESSKSSQSLPSSQLSDYLNETIVNEDIVSSLSVSALDDNDKELVDLLLKEGEEENPDEETLEMSQICWNSDPFSQE